MEQEHPQLRWFGGRRSDDELFESWITRADSAALGSLFDRMSPRLLAAAIHLVGDSGRGEDLVQAVFMTLIEKRTQIDPDAPAEAWLARVLRNRAVDERRAHRADVPTSNDLEARASAPDQPIERQELERRISEAIDGLDAPYREVLLARLRHGASAAEIAHLFQRSPGQVRVQLHRGLALLRARLPKREALAAIAWLMPGLRPDGATSLDAVREAVTHAASIAAATAAPTALTLAPSFLVMSKTKLVVLACAAALLAGYAILSVPQAISPRTVDADLDQAGAPDELRETTLEVIAAGAPDHEPVVWAPTETSRFIGRVVKAASGTPAVGVAVRLIRPVASLESWDELRLMGEFPELVSQQGSLDGSLQSAHGADWPLPEHIESRLLARPLDPRNRIELETVTDAEGRYVLDVPSGLLDRVLVEVEAEGFGPRLRPLAGVVRPAASATGAESNAGAESDTGDEFTQADIAIFVPYVLSGQLFDGANQEPLRKSLPVTALFVQLKEDPDFARSGAYDPSSVEFMGAWATASDESGAFEFTLFGEEPQVGANHPGWSRSRVSFDRDTDPVRLFLSPATRFRFVDAETGESLESVSLTLAPKSGGTIYCTGRYLTPDGIFGLYGNSAYLNRECPMELVAWTSAHAPTSVRVDDFNEPRDYVLTLQAGEPLTLQLRLSENGRPVSGRIVALCADRPKYWDPLRLRRPTVTSVSGADGRARLAAPHGNYVLTVGSYKDPKTTRFVTLPCEEPIEIQLDQLGSIEATVRVGGQIPAEEGTCVVVLDGPDGRHSQPEIDHEGKVSFRGLPEGEYQVRPVVFRRTGANSGGADSMRDIRVTRGGRAEVQLDMAPSVERRCRLRLDGVLDFSGWEARTNGHDWSQVAADGLLEPLIPGEMTWVQVEDGIDRRFTVYVPSGRALEHIVDLTGGDRSYRGRLTDGAGQPLAGVWVQAQPTPMPRAEDPKHHSVASATDTDGRFAIEGLHRQAYILRFDDRKERGHTWEPRWQSMTFVPDTAPRSDDQGAFLDIQLASSTEEVVVRGVVVDGSGEPCAARVSGRALRRSGEGGTLEVGGKTRHQSIGLDGAFEVALPSGVPCRLRFSAEGAEPGAHTDELLHLDPNVEPPPLRVVVER